MLEQSVPERLHPMERTHAEAVHEAGKDSHWRSLWRTVSPGKDPTLEQAMSVRSPSPENEGTAQTMCDELTEGPFPYPPALLRGRRQRKEYESEVKLGKKEFGERGEGILKFGLFCIILLRSDL